MLSFSDELTLEGASISLSERNVPFHRGSLKDFLRGLANEYMVNLVTRLGTVLGRSSLLNLPRVPMKIGGDAVAWVAETAGMVAGEAASLLDKATFDDEYVTRKKNARKQKEIKGFASGLAEAVRDVGEGFDGVKDIIRKPRQGFSEGGIEGAVMGCCHGIASGVVKPTAGIVQAFADAGAGVGATAAEAIQKQRRGRHRHRQPRLLYSGGAAIRTWCELDAEVLRQLGPKRLFGVEEVVCLEKRERQHTVLLLFKDRFLLVEMHAAQDGNEKDTGTGSMNILGAIDETTMKLFNPINNVFGSVQHLLHQWQNQESGEEEMPEFEKGGKCLSMDLCLLHKADIDDDDTGPRLRLTKAGAPRPIVLPLYHVSLSKDVQDGLLAGFCSAVEHPDGAANWDKLHQALRVEERNRQECAELDSVLKLETGKKTLEVFEVERWRLATGTWATPFLPIDSELCWRWVDATGRKHPHLQPNLAKDAAAKKNQPPCELDALFTASDSWKVETGESTDSEGWRYGLAWKSSTWDKNPCSFDVLRKRKWLRTYA